MSTNIRSFNIHFSIGTLCRLKSVSSTRCLQASQLIWSTKPCHSIGNGWCPLLDICRRTEELCHERIQLLLFNLYLSCVCYNRSIAEAEDMAVPESYIKKDFMVKRSLMKSWLIKKENYKSRWFLLTRVCLCYCDGSMEVDVCYFSFGIIFVDCTIGC